MNILGYLQRIGKSLMLPVATLPIAAILLRLGQSDVFNIPFMSEAGNAIFANLPILFALGIAVGLSKDDAGAAALAGAVGYFVLTKGTEVLGNYTEVSYYLQSNVDQLHSYIVKDGALIAKLKALAIGSSAALDSSGMEIPNSVVNNVKDVKLDLSFFGGVIAGIVAGHSYNRFSHVRLPDYLAFFGGKRLIPIMTGLFCLILAFVCGHVWSYVQNGINVFSQFVSGSGPFGEFIYGVMNRALIPFGLHHILHSVFWFGFLGDCVQISYDIAAEAGNLANNKICLAPSVVKDLVVGGAVLNELGLPIEGSKITTITDSVVRGDLNRFFAGDRTAGVYMAWAYPLFMFGLPAAAFAMYCAAPKGNRAKVGGLLLSLGFTSFLTGITEPIEFTFLFIAPVLYIVHAILAGVSMVVVNSLGILHGFGFSAGLIDFVLNWGLAKKPALLIPIGLIFAVIYFAVFYFTIKWLDLKTPGREVEGDIQGTTRVDENLATIAQNFIDAAGGANNLESIEACITRLRLSVVDADLVDSAMAKKLGASGVIRLNKRSVQIVVGGKAETIADAMKQLVKKVE